MLNSTVDEVSPGTTNENGIKEKLRICAFATPLQIERWTYRQMVLWRSGHQANTHRFSPAFSTWMRLAHHHTRQEHSNEHPRRLRLRGWVNSVYRQAIRCRRLGRSMAAIDARRWLQE
ncbi:MAG: hypothetical protein IPF79_05615 [Ignavibacteria bacterium]|nr:hypothetical protein [Ignavibacteria bacterium]